MAETGSAADTSTVVSNVTDLSNSGADSASTGQAVASASVDAEAAEGRATADGLTAEASSTSTAETATAEASLSAEASSTSAAETARAGAEATSEAGLATLSVGLVIVVTVALGGTASRNEGSEKSCNCEFHYVVCCLN